MNRPSHLVGRYSQRPIISRYMTKRQQETQNSHNGIHGKWTTFKTLKKAL